MKKVVNKGIMGQKSFEKIWHFSCGVCRKWWSVGDAPARKKKWFCPWCGAEQTFK